MEINQLSQRPNLYNNLSNLLNRAFSYPLNFNFCIDFYPLIEPSNWDNNFILIHKNNLIGHIGVVQRVVRGMNIVFIGGVAIDKHYRSRGLGRKLIEYVIEKFHSTTHQFLLWGDNHKFYSHHNFSLGGSMLVNFGSKKPRSTYFKTNISQLTFEEKRQINDIYQSYNKDRLIPTRTLKNWNSIYKISSVSIYYHKEKNQITSYYFKDKGLDLNDIVHEYGHVPGFQNILLEELSTQNVWGPQNCPLLRQMTNNYQPLALIRPGKLHDNQLDDLFVYGVDSI